MKKGNAENVLLGILTSALVVALIYILNEPNSSEISSSYNNQINNYGENIIAEQENITNYAYNLNETQEAEPLQVFDNYKNNRFYYNQLSLKQKLVYETLEKGFNNFSSVIKIGNSSTDDLVIAVHSIGMDHPEFYWIDQYNCITMNGLVVEARFEVPSDASETIDKINTKVDSIIYQMNFKGLNSDYDKIKFFYDWIITNTDYYQAPDSQTITSVFVNNKSVCSGYSKAFLYLCQKVGIECAFVAGYTNNDNTHAWNLVKIGNNYYWVDTTWGDPVFAGEADQNINYSYFLVDDTDFLKNHKIEYTVQSQINMDSIKAFEYPSCNDSSLNYYKKIGAYFNHLNANDISIFLREKFKNNELDNIELEFKEKDDYNYFIEEYLKKENARIFDEIRYYFVFEEGSIYISYETIERAQYVKIKIEMKK